MNHFRALSCLISFVALSAEAQPAASPSAGPQSPIGHSLESAESKRRIEELVARETSEGKEAAHGFHEHEALTGIPRAFVSLGNAEPAFGVVVEKLHHRLSVFERAPDKTYRLVKSYRAITGKSSGDKERRGDLRTPEGVYFATGRMEDAQLPPKYGVLAFTLDFPNVFDRQKRKTGSGIWIHATDKPSRLLTPFDTEGCVALSNEDILDLEKYIVPFQTPVVITKEVSTVASEQDLQPERDAALAMVEGWRSAWERSDFDSYSGYYSPRFKSLGKDRNAWLATKQWLGEERGSSIRVRTSEPKIVAFESQLLAVFYQEYQSERKSDFGQKFLYLHWEGDRYRIIAEKWYPAPRVSHALQALK